MSHSSATFLPTLDNKPTHPSQLLVLLKDQSRPMSKAAISHFIRQLIRFTHETFPDAWIAH